MLSLANITKRFGATVALDDVSFAVAAGEVHALLGENGAGKSTLVRIAGGLIAPDAGEVVVTEGTATRRSLRIATPRDARKAGIGMVHQHFTSIPALTVAENIALSAGWHDSGRALGRRAAAAIARLGLPLESGARVAGLSVQLRQRLEIVQALAGEATILLLDEPTAVLAPREVAELLALVRRLRDGGAAVVLISHKLAEVMQVADRVTVLRRGRVTWCGPAAGVGVRELSRAMIGADAVEDRSPGGGRSPRDTTNGAHPTRVRIGSLELRGGEVIGVAAIEGNGQRELLRSIAGLHAAAPGVDVEGDVAIVPEDRVAEALLPDVSLTGNLLLGRLDRSSRWLDWDALRNDTAALMARHDVRATNADARAGTLSGGNQQKFVLGRALARRPAVLVAEDPTRGLDLVATRAVRDALIGAARDGACVIVHSSDLDEVLEVADRLLVVCRGEVTELPREASRELVGDAMLGVG